MSEKLYIPTGLKVKSEIVAGFGKEEFIKTTILSLLLNIVNIIIYIFTEDMMNAIIYFIISITISFFIFVKDNNNISIGLTVKYMTRYIFGQKKYMYEYENIFLKKGD